VDEAAALGAQNTQKVASWAK
jgi:hypothetical protein